MILFSLTFLVTLSPSTLFSPKIKADKLQKKLQNFPYLVTAFPIFSLRLKYGIKKSFSGHFLER